MAALLESVEGSSVWGRFKSLRDHLFDQFQKTPFIPETGLSPSALQTEVDAFLGSHPGMPRVLQKAHAYRIAVTQGQIYVDPRDWFVDKLNHGNLVRKLRDGWYREAQSGILKTEADWFSANWKRGVVRGLLDMGHISPGWGNMFQAGLTGLMANARQARNCLGSKATSEQIGFYRALEIVYQATIDLAHRFADQAEALVPSHRDHAPRLQAIAETSRRVPAYGPRTFYEALQFAWLMHELIEMEGENVRSMGHFDRTLYPFYRADIQAGRLTRDQAKELIQFFWFKFYARTRGAQNGKNFAFSGQDADGAIIANDLTYLGLEAFEELKTPDPKLSVRFLPETPEKLYRRVADLIRNGHNSFVLMNDIPSVEAQVRRGKTLEDARIYLPIGCYEPAVDGKEAGCTMNLVLNIAKAVELALHNGIDPLTGERVGPKTGGPSDFKTFDDLNKAFEKQMAFLINRSVAYVQAHERQWPRINPSPLIAGTIDDCIARGKDIGQGGAHYNGVGCVGAGLANACDSLMALKQGVFEEKRYTLPEILEALHQDFENREPMRQYLLNRIPKWGNNDPESDALARQIADHYCHTVHRLMNARGGPVQAALFTLNYQLTMGQNTGALPDGRKARTALAPGCGAMSGRDKNGITGLIGSVTRLDFNETPNGSVLDVTLHPTAVQGENGLTAMVALIQTFFSQGGYAIQFNVFDAGMLKDAQKNPENYASMQIRVTGWSVFFTTLTRSEQDLFLKRIAHSLS